MKSYTRHLRINSWKLTIAYEVRKFFGMVLYMNAVKYPEVSDYRKHNIFYRNALIPKNMSRNSFQLLLFLHFADNEIADKTDYFKFAMGSTLCSTSFVKDLLQAQRY